MELRRTFARLAATTCVAFAAVTVAVAVLVGSASGASPTRAAIGRHLASKAAAWGTAKEVPGTATLNVKGDAGINGISCPTGGFCAAAGYYRAGSGDYQAFVVNEASGTWGSAKEIPGLGKLNAGGDANVDSVSCASAGNCAVGGRYQDGSLSDQAFLVTETKGSWGKAEEVPGTAKLNAGGQASITSIACPSAGNCAAGGIYMDKSGNVRAFVVTETNGTWNKAEKVPGLANLGTGGSWLTSISCPSAGNCAAGGYYCTSAGACSTDYGRGVPVVHQAFVVTETKGSWSNAIEAPGTAALNTGEEAQLDTISCATAGNCAAGGYYTDGSGHLQAFVINETKGAWANAQEVPGTAALNVTGNADLESVSCPSARNCSAGGYYRDASDNYEAFVVNETGGTWGSASEVLGMAQLNTGGQADLGSVSCWSAGNCAAGGAYRLESSSGLGYEAYVVTETSGVWGTAEEVPGTAALNAKANASVESLSCAHVGKCAAGGVYDGTSGYEAFVDNYK